MEANVCACARVCACVCECASACERAYMRTYNYVLVNKRATIFHKSMLRITLSNSTQHFICHSHLFVML